MRHQRAQHRLVAVGRLDEQLRLPVARRGGLQPPQGVAARLRLHRQVAVKRKALAVHARGHQGQQQRRGPDQRHDGDAVAVRGRDQQRTRIGDPGTARVGEEAQVVSRQRRGEQLGAAPGVRCRADLDHADRLQRQCRCQRLEELPRRLGALDHVEREPARDFDRALRQHVGRRGDAEEAGDEVKPAGGHRDGAVSRAPGRRRRAASSSAGSAAGRSAPWGRRSRSTRRARSPAPRTGPSRRSPRVARARDRRRFPSR